MTERTALVTGATGFIGARLAVRLLAAGWKVRLLVRNPGKLDPALRQQANVIAGDLSDLAALRCAMSGSDLVFHCAANVATWDRWQSYLEVNLQGVKNLLDILIEVRDSERDGSAPGRTSLPDRSIRLVHLSTMDVYGFPESPCTEDAETSPSGFGYGDSKRLGEILVRQTCEAHAVPFTIFRPGNVIGPGSQFVARMAPALQSGLMLKIGHGSTNAGLIHVDNLIDYLLWSASSDVAIGQCYNLRDDYDASWADFIDALRKGIAGKGIVLDLPYPVANGLASMIEMLHRAVAPRHEPLLHRLLVRFFGRTCGHDARKIRDHSGIAGRIDFQQAMAQSVQWYLGTRRTA